MSWRPLLEGALKARALESVDAITNDLATLGRAPADPSLAEGTAGLSVLHGYLARAGHRAGAADTAIRCLRSATAAAADSPTEASLYGGLAGVGWSLAHLQGRVPGLDGEDELAEIDNLLLDHLAEPYWTGDYDLINGLVGFGVYALERREHTTA